MFFSNNKLSKFEDMKFSKENGRKAETVTLEVIFDDMVRSTFLQGRHFAEILASANKCALLAFDANFGKVESRAEERVRGPLGASVERLGKKSTRQSIASAYPPLTFLRNI